MKPPAAVPPVAEAAASAQLGQYPTRPDLTVRLQFLEHVKRTGRPETFAGVVSDRSSQLQTDELVADFTIDPKARGDGTMCPCSYCSGLHPKFLKGTLTWSPHDGHLRLVGHICAATVFGEVRHRAMRAEYDGRMRVEQAGDFLLLNLIHAKALIQAAEALMPSATAISSVRQQLRRRFPKLINDILKVAKDHQGQRVVIRRAVREAGGEGPRGVSSSTSGQSEFEAVSLGAFSGLPMIDAGMPNAVGQLRSILTNAPPSCDDEDAVIRSLAASTDGQKLAWARSLRAMPAALEALRIHLAEARLFATRETLRGLLAWGGRPDAPVQLRGSIYERELALWTREEGGHRVPLLDTLIVPAVPNIAFA